MRALGRASRLAVASAAATVALAIGAGSAEAVAATCTYDSGSHTVTATISDHETVVFIVGAGGAIVFLPAGVGGPCEAATVTNTDDIVVTGPAAPVDPALVVIALDSRYGLPGGLFAPGFTDEPGTSDEIEWSFDAGISNLGLYGTSSADTFVQGTLGVNLNAAENPDDLDIATVGTLSTGWFGEGGSDVLSSAGGSATGGPVAGGSEFYGGLGNDVLTAGWVGDLYGGPGGDFLSCGPSPEEGRINYDDSPAGVLVDLRVSGPPVFGLGDAQGDSNPADDCEDVVGSEFADVLAGDNGKNSLIGLGGNDAILGRDGNDLVAGWGGNDRLFGGDGDDTVVGYDGRDTLFGGRGDDTLNADDDERDLVIGAPGNDQCDCDLPGDGSPVSDLVFGVATLF